MNRSARSESPMSPRRFHFFKVLEGLALALCLTAAPMWRAAAQTASFTPYQVKALIIFKFAKYTEWPKETFASENAPFVLGILGEDPFGADIDIIKGKTIKGRKLEVKHFSSVQEAADCQLLFISRSETDKVPQILKALENSSVLTIAEAEGFIEKRGIINLIAEKKAAGTQTVGFEINQAAAGKANLKFDTQLLQQAKKVKT